MRTLYEWHHVRFVLGEDQYLVRLHKVIVSSTKDSQLPEAPKKPHISAMLTVATVNGM